MNQLARKVLYLALTAAAFALTVERADAGPFNKTTRIEGVYLMGTESIQEFDAFNLEYPDYADSATFIFTKNSKVEIWDEMSGSEYGTYKRFSSNSRITVTVTSAQSPYGPITFELYREGNTDIWWGEVRFDGDVWGHFRGTLR